MKIEFETQSKQLRTIVKVLELIENVSCNQWNDFARFTAID